MTLLDCIDQIGRERLKLESLIREIDIPEHQEGLGLCLDDTTEKFKQIEDALALIVDSDQSLKKSA